MFGSIDSPIYQIAPAGLCQVNCNIGLKPQRGKKTNTQPKHCQEIGVIVSLLVSHFHLRNMVRTGFADSTRTICHLRRCFWEISFSRVSLAPGFIIWLMLILIFVIFVTLVFILYILISCSISVIFLFFPPCSLSVRAKSVFQVCQSVSSWQLCIILHWYRCKLVSVHTGRMLSHRGNHAETKEATVTNKSKVWWSAHAWFLTVLSL